MHFLSHYRTSADFLLETPTHPLHLLFLEPESVHGRGIEQREGLSLNRGCRASLQQISHATWGWKPGTIADGSNRPSHQGRCAPSPIYRNTMDGGKAVVLRRFTSFHCSDRDKAQSHAGGGREELGKDLLRASLVLAFPTSSYLVLRMILCGRYY